MAKVECRSAQPSIPPVWVEVEGITDRQVGMASQLLNEKISATSQVSDAVAAGFVAVASLCPDANPSDLWLAYRLSASGGVRVE